MSLHSYRTGLAILTMSFFAAGCSTETDSMEISDQQSLTLVRRQVLPWKHAYDRELVVSSLPGCMRRYILDRDDTGDEALEVYQAEGGNYLLKDGHGAWLANLADCTLTRSANAPSGERIGVFESRGQVLRFSRLTNRNPE